MKFTVWWDGKGKALEPDGAPIETRHHDIGPVTLVNAPILSSPGS